MVTCRSTGLRYIGITSQSVNKRWRQHVWTATTKRSVNKFHLAIQAYGPDSFEVETLHEYETWQDACYAEVCLISALDLISGGLNSSLGGDRPAITPETRAKQSAAKKGKKQTPDHIARRTAGQRGRPRSAEAIEKTRLANIGRKRPPNSPETRLRHSIAGRGKKRTPEQCARYSAANRKRWARWRAEKEARASGLGTW